MKTLLPIIFKNSLVLSMFLVNQFSLAFADEALDELMKKYGATQSTNKNAPNVESNNREPASITKSLPTKSKNEKLKQAEEEQKKSQQVNSESESTSDKTTEEPKAVNISLAYKLDVIQNFEGGIEKKGGVLGSGDINVELNLEKLIHIPSTQLVLYGLGIHGDDPTEFVGDDFATSNIEAPNTFKLYEAYFQHDFDDYFSGIFGLRDLNADFYVADSAGDLLNGAFGIGPVISQTGVHGPSIFPNTAPALTFHYKSPKKPFFQLGIFNGVSGSLETEYGSHFHSSSEEGYLLITETGIISECEKGILKSSIGLWVYTKEQDALDSSKDKGSNYGFYGLLDYPLKKDLSGFLKYGIANDQINAIDTSYELGVLWNNPFEIFEGDKFTAGVASIQSSNDNQILNDLEKSQTAFEIAYKVNFPFGIGVTADLQQITNPGFSKETKDALVGAMRFEIEY